MQLGMVGLGRMGANLVRRLMRDGHECVVYDVNKDAIKELEGEGAKGGDTLDEFLAKLSKPRAVWVMVPGRVHRRHGDGDRQEDGSGRHHHRRRQLVLPRRHRPGQGARGDGRPLRGLRDERRRVRARPRLLPDDRRRGRRRHPPRPDLQDDRARRGHRAPHARAAPASRRPPRTATCTAVRTVRATS